jgi:hypothetical protein
MARNSLSLSSPHVTTPEYLLYFVTTHDGLRTPQPPPCAERRPYHHEHGRVWSPKIGMRDSTINDEGGRRRWNVAGGKGGGRDGDRGFGRCLGGDDNRGAASASTDGTGFPAPVVARPLRRRCVRPRGGRTRPASTTTTTTTTTARPSAPSARGILAGWNTKGGGIAKRGGAARRGTMGGRVGGGRRGRHDVGGGMRRLAGAKEGAIDSDGRGGVIDESTRGGGGERSMDASPRNGAVRVRGLRHR